MLNEETKKERNKLLDLYETAKGEVQKVIVGLDEYFLSVFICLIIPERFPGEPAGGNLLAEASHGLAKTKMIETVAQVCQLDFKRMQFTPEITVGDILGTVYPDPREPWKKGKLKRGPIFTDLLLADELNRSPTRVHAALLEPMEERQVTFEDRTETLSKYFRVFATINPCEEKRTANYPLTQAEQDRFTLTKRIGYLTDELERKVLARATETIASPRKVITGSDIDRMSAFVKRCFLVPVHERLRNLCQSIVAETRAYDAIEIAASTRAALDILRVAATFSFLAGDDKVLPSHVVRAAQLVLAKRLLFKDYEVRDIGEEIRKLLDRIPVREFI